MSDECLELKNIKYQTMLLNNNSKVDSSKQNTANLEEFLEKEKTSNTKKSWSKLGRSTKLIKLINFVNYFAAENNLNITEKNKLLKYLNEAMDKKNYKE